MITHARNQKKDIHIVYLDVTKVYDKAWVDAIMYVMYKEGLRTIAWKLSQNLIATVNTRYGPTRKKKMKSIRQGGVFKCSLGY